MGHPHEIVPLTLKSDNPRQKYQRAFHGAYCDVWNFNGEEIVFPDGTSDVITYFGVVFHPEPQQVVSTDRKPFDIFIKLDESYKTIDAVKRSAKSGYYHIPPHDLMWGLWFSVGAKMVRILELNGDDPVFVFALKAKIESNPDNWQEFFYWMENVESLYLLDSNFPADLIPALSKDVQELLEALKKKKDEIQAEREAQQISANEHDFNVMKAESAAALDVAKAFISSFVPNSDRIK